MCVCVCVRTRVCVVCVCVFVSLIINLIIPSQMPKRKASITFMVTDWQQMGARAGVPHEPVSLYPKSLAVVAPASAADHNRVTCVPKPGRWSRLGYPGSLGKSAG